MKFTIIIVTKDRPEDLQKCLQSIAAQTVLPQQVIIVDASASQQVIEKSNLPIEHYSCAPGITKQRNLARTKVAGDTDIVVYLDDDTELFPNTLEKTVKAFQMYDKHTVGFTGTIVGEAKAGWFKKILGWFTGLYSTKAYSLTYGLFNIINPAPWDHLVKWLPGAFMCYRWQLVKDVPFDEWFTEYGLGEDFEFSWRVSHLSGWRHNYSLEVVPDMEVKHHHSSVGRNWRKFGYMRIVNRNYLRTKFFPKQAKWWLGMWWANGWLLLFNAVRSLYSKRYREEFAGNVRGVYHLFTQSAPQTSLL